MFHCAKLQPIGDSKYSAVHETLYSDGVFSCLGSMAEAFAQELDGRLLESIPRPKIINVDFFMPEKKILLETWPGGHMEILALWVD